jgi:hypothetical protein
MTVVISHAPLPAMPCCNLREQLMLAVSGQPKPILLSKLFLISLKIQVNSVLASLINSGMLTIALMKI